MPLFACGRGYSRKLPIATVAVMVVCVVIVCVPVGVVEDGVALVLLQATKSRVRSIKEHNKDGRFMILCRHLTPCRAFVRTKNRCFGVTEGASTPCESSVSSSRMSPIFPLNS